MEIDKAVLLAFATGKALPAIWAWFVAHTMTSAQLVDKYCKPVTEMPANMTDFQKEQYEKQCAQMGKYIFEAKKPKAEETAPNADN